MRTGRQRVGGEHWHAVDAGDGVLVVRVSPDLNRRVADLAREQHITSSQLLRLGARLLVDAPADVVAALVADPRGERTRIVPRAIDLTAEAADTPAA